LEDATLRQNVANLGRDHYERKFTWKVAWDALSGHF
jgi:hypothetical protein